MPAILNTALQWIAQYGYFALFGLLMLGIAGLPVPDETLLVFSGVLIARGNFNPAAAFVAGCLGSSCGITLSYAIGRSLGHAAVLRYGKRFGLSNERMAHVHLWFERTGEWLLAFGYFIPGVRHLTALAAGASDLAFSRFAVFAWPGAAVWVGTFLVFGYLVGENWGKALAFVEHYTLLAVLAAGFVVTLVWWVRRRLVQ